MKKGSILGGIFEAVDVKKLVKDLIETPSSKENADQGKFVQLLKGLAFSEDPESDKFMMKLMDTVSKENFSEFIK